MTKKSQVTPDILEQAGFVLDDMIELLELGGDGFVAENCRVTFRLNGAKAVVCIILDTGSTVTLTIDVDSSPEALPRNRLN